MPRQESLESLDALIHTREAELVDLKRQRNNLIPACILPSEILVNIFKYSQHHTGNFDEARPWRRFNKDWHEIMLVCRQFRHVAIEAAVLWCYIDYEDHNEERRALGFERSAQHLLRIYDNQSSPVHEYFPRAWSISIDRVDSPELLHSPAPHLQYLHLMTGTDEDGAHILIDKSFLGGGDLKLLDLSVRAVTIGQVPMMATLRRLVLERVYAPGGLPDFSGLFMQTPSIEEICLVNCVHFWELDDTQPMPPPVNLPHLQSLSIFGDHPKAVSGLLSILPTPRSAMGLLVENSSGAGVADLDASHAHIFQTWLDFAKRHDDNPSLGEGAVLRCSQQPIIVHYGNELQWSDFSRNSPSFCRIWCQITGAHPVLDRVVAFHLADSSVMSTSLEPFDGSIDADQQACFLPNVRDLILESSGGDLTRPGMSAAIKAWIVSRGRQIKRVRFVRCSTSMSTLADELRQEELVPVVT
jgi:hypothetical protein